jgi:hypothetical protein
MKMRTSLATALILLSLLLVEKAISQQSQGLERQQQVQHPTTPRVKILLLCFVLAQIAVGFGSTCRLPSYREGKVTQNASSASLTISVGRSGFAPNRLICLVEHFKQAYPHHDLLDILFFDSHAAAVRYSPGAIDPSSKAVEYQAQMHALYHMDTSMHEEYLLLMPDPLLYDASSPSNTKIDFPFSGVPVCKLRVGNRCLLMFHHILYPWRGESAKVSGDITVKGIISREGIVKKLTVADAMVDPINQKAVLVDAALQNLETWRFQDSREATPIRVTYSFKLVHSPALKYRTDVQFALPQRVTIETSEVP